jgi:hypothetical protein
MNSIPSFPGRRLAVLLVLALCFAACGGGGGGGGVVEPVELPPFHIASATPFEGSTEVALAQTILVRFNKAIDPATVGINSLSVASVAGASMAGTVSILEGGANDTLRWIPIHDMATGEQHQCSVEAALRSVDDEELGGPTFFRFFTEIPMPPGFFPTQDQLRTSNGSLIVGRQGHRATLLSDGRVLISGGFTIGGATTDRAEVFFEITELFVELAPRMGQSRASHTATRLNDGRVLVTGGWFEGSPGQNNVRQSAEVFVPTTNTWVPVGEMTKQRTDHAALLLPDGRVLITGGSRLASATFLEDLDDAEVFNPTTGLFTALAAPMSHTRATHGMVPSISGKFVLAGGSDTDLGHGWFDTTSMTFQDLGAAASDRARFGTAAASFADGGVVIAGGDTVGSVAFVTTNGFVLNTGSGLTVPRSYATAMRIKPDQILIAGGIDFSNGSFIESTCDVVVQGGVGGASTFATSVRFGAGMAFSAASYLSSGDILYCGGLNEDGSFPNKTNAFIFDVR